MPSLAYPHTKLWILHIGESQVVIQVVRQDYLREGSNASRPVPVQLSFKGQKQYCELGTRRQLVSGTIVLTLAYVRSFVTELWFPNDLLMEAHVNSNWVRLPNSIIYNISNIPTNNTKHWLLGIC